MGAVGRLLGLVTALAVWCGPEAAAQELDPNAGADRAVAQAAVMGGATGVQGNALALWGMRLALGLGSSVQMGGAGFVTAPVTYGATGPRRLRMGYGGLEVEFPLPAVNDPNLRMSILVGGGNADVSDAIVGTELGSDNFLVLEPRVAWGRALSGPWRGSLSLGYRRAFGVDDLPDSENADLSGITVLFALYILRR